MPALMMAVMSRFWGALSDAMMRRKAFFVLGRLVAGAISTGYLLTSDVNALIALLALYSFASSAVDPAINAALTSVGRKLGKIVGDYSMIRSASWTVGTMIGGFLADRRGVQLVFALCFALQAAGGLLSLLYREPQRPKGRIKLSAKAIMGEYVALKDVSGPTGFLMLSMFLMGFGRSLFSPLFRVKFYDVVERSKTLYSLAWALGGVGGILANPLYGRLSDKLGRKPVLVSAMAAYSAYYPILAFFDDPIVLTILWVIPIYPALIISSTVLIAELTSESERARSMGTLGAFQSIAQAVGPIASGTSAELIGPKLTMLSSSVFTLGAALFGQYKVKSTKTTESKAEHGNLT